MWTDRFKMPTVISLVRRTDRRAAVGAELARMGLGFEFFDAIEGRDNKFAAWFYRTILKQTASVTPGSFGVLFVACECVDAGDIGPSDWSGGFCIDHGGRCDLALQCDGGGNRGIAARRVPGDANMIKFGISDFVKQRKTLVERGQVREAAEGVYLQTNVTGGTLMYAVRKSILPSLLEFENQGNFDNTVLRGTYVLLPWEDGVVDEQGKHIHLGCAITGAGRRMWWRWGADVMRGVYTLGVYTFYTLATF